MNIKWIMATVVIMKWNSDLPKDAGDPTSRGINMKKELACKDTIR